MPSHALAFWQRVRIPRLNDVDGQCAATRAAVPLPDLADENLRAYVLLLSAHFQGFCRDLYTECVQVLVAQLPTAMWPMFQKQCLTALELDGANPRYETIRKDFERFGFDIGLALSAGVANAARITHLGHLNSWRNYVAHSKTSIPLHGGPFTLATVQSWRSSCDELAKEFDAMMYTQIRTITQSPPW